VVFQEVQLSLGETEAGSIEMRGALIGLGRFGDAIIAGKRAVIEEA
jgi:hypothetical protein